FELLDTGVFNEDRYFDIFIEYAKAGADDICIKITAVNRGPDAAPLHILPTVWFRDTWTWNDLPHHPVIQRADIDTSNLEAIQLQQEELGIYWLLCEGSSSFLFTENETNAAKLYNGTNESPYTKDGFNRYVIDNEQAAVNQQGRGTKASPHYVLMLPPKGSETIYLRLSSQADADRQKFASHDDFISQCEDVFKTRIAEADEFYTDIIPANLSDDQKNVMR